MRAWGVSAAVALGIVAAAPPAAAEGEFTVPGAGGGEALPYLQCVPYARQVSGIRIYGDAHTWWQQAAGRYARGSRPRVGAVMSFRPYANMRLGHVAAVSRVIDARTVELRHANWSPIGGRRGQVEDGVRAVDVSPGNDWSEVRVWFAPIGALGATRWPLNGFIYPEGADAPLAPTTLVAAPAGPKRSRIGEDFLNGIAAEEARPARAAARARRGGDDPIGDLIARVG